MTVHELRDPDEALRFLRQGLWLARAHVPDAAGAQVTLGWSLALASLGEPLPPLGFLADVGRLALGDEVVKISKELLPGWPMGLVRAYEDNVLSNLAVDSSFERGAAALRRYHGAERDRAFLFLVEGLRRRADFGGVLINPALIKGLQNPEGLLRQGWQDLQENGPLPLLVALVEELIARIRQTADVVEKEELFELEHGTALAPFGERVALRQVLQAVTWLEAGVPKQPPRPQGGRREVATRMLAEDAYPVGGFASLSTRGSIESLLQSQLAYMEPDERPDLFDAKFVRDELLYYSRDENQFWRRRRTFFFLLHPDLVHARVKDPGLPTQRILCLLALIVATIRTLTQWLGNDALLFEVVFLTGDEDSPLGPERALLEMLLREALATGAVTVTQAAEPELLRHGAEQARRSLCHGLIAAMEKRSLEVPGAHLRPLDLGQSTPDLDGKKATPGDNATEGWHTTLWQLLTEWT